MKLLIIEDTVVFASMVKAKLERINEQVEVMIFDKVTKALGQTSMVPDIIILDHFLPGINGVDALPVIKEKFKESKVIVFSGQNDINIMANSYNAGADLYLSKDNNSINKLVKAVEEIIISKMSSVSDREFKRLRSIFATVKGKKYL